MIQPYAATGCGLVGPIFTELLSRELGLPMFKLEGWRQKAEADTTSTELATAMQRIGELSMENELLRARIERPGPLAWRRSR